MHSALLTLTIRRKPFLIETCFGPVWSLGLTGPTHTQLRQQPEQTDDQLQTVNNHYGNKVENFFIENEEFNSD